MTTSPVGQVLHYLRRTAYLQNAEGSPDGELLDNFLSRQDQTAFEALVGRHGAMVWGVCRRILPNSTDAEDAFQATFLVLVRKANTLLGRDTIGNWLHGVAYNTALKAGAAIIQRRTKERQVKPVLSDENDVWQELQPHLDRELRRLPDKYRQPVILCDLEGKPRHEAAVLLGVPEGTVSSRLSRGRSILVQRLSRHVSALSVGAVATFLAQETASANAPATLVSSTVKAASLLAAGEVTGVVSTQVIALTERVLKGMFLSKLKLVVAILLIVGAGVGVSGYLTFAQEQELNQPAKQVEAKAPENDDLSWVEKRVQEWQPTKEERRFDEIGWARDIQEAKRLGKANGRPVFVFTHKGHMQVGRC